MTHKLDTTTRTHKFPCSPTQFAFTDPKRPLLTVLRAITRLAGTALKLNLTHSAVGDVECVGAFSEADSAAWSESAPDSVWFFGVHGVFEAGGADWALAADGFGCGDFALFAWFWVEEFCVGFVAEFECPVSHGHHFPSRW